MAEAIADGRKFEADELAKSVSQGKNVTGRNRLVAQNGEGNVKGNRTDTDQLIKNNDGTYSIVETKRSSNTKLSTGQQKAKNHVGENGNWFEIRTKNEKFNLIPGDKIYIIDYTRVNKIE